MLAICSAAKPVGFKAPKLSSSVERVLQGTKPRAQPGHKKHSTSLKQPFVSSKEETKGGSSKAPTSSKNGHSKKRKESSSAMDSNPSQPLVSTHVDTGMHKEDHQATDGQASLGVTSEERANPRLSSGCDASAYSTAKATPGLSVPNDSIPQQQGMDERTKNTSFDHISVGTNPHVLVDQTQSVSEGLETVLTQPTIGKGINSITRQAEEESSRIIKLEDLAKLVSNVQTNFKDLNSPEDDPVIVVDNSDEDEEDEVHTTANAKTEDTFSQKHKLELEKKKPEAEAALLKAQPSFPNMGQLNELLVKSLQTEFSKILSAHDFSSSLPSELKVLLSNLNELTKEVKGLKKQVHEWKIKLPGDLKEIPTKLEDFTKIVTNLTSQIAELKTLQWELPTEFLSLPEQVASVQAKLKTLDALPSLLINVTKSLNKFAQVLDFALSKAGD
ncbi:zf-CCHC domain-containing protein [Tanacetum coccineum]